MLDANPATVPVTSPIDIPLPRGVARATTVLRVLARERAGLSLAEAARRAGLMPSTCLHILRAFVREGFVTFEDHAYRTGPALLGLVKVAMASDAFIEAAQPVLDDFASKGRVTAIALQGDSCNQMVVVSISRPSMPITLHVNLGSHFPAVGGVHARRAATMTGAGQGAARNGSDRSCRERISCFDHWFKGGGHPGGGASAIARDCFRGLSIIGALLPARIDRPPRGIVLMGFEHHLTPYVAGRLSEKLNAAAAFISTRIE